jgi:predicted ferric reductase
MSAIRSGVAQEFFPESNHLGEKFRPKAHFSSIGFINDTLALFRWIFYRSIPDIVIGKYRFTFSSLSVLVVTFIAFAFVTIYTFLQQPLYWESIRYGAPPVAIRAGMLSVALTPWIVATSMKLNILTMLLGLGPERLNVFHRWLSYIALFLALIHMIPFFVQPVWDDNGMSVWASTFPPGSGIIYGTGVACIVPLIWLCVTSLPWIRRVAYELFVMCHVPVGILYVGVLFWHTNNRLMTWDYLYVTAAIWGGCNFLRLFKLNWAWPGRLSFMVGDEAAITLMGEKAIKITIPTQMRWKPGQYVYLRMPGIAFLDNHPFTISSLCSEDFPSEYGENYRDCILLFKAYGGFTRKVLDTAIEKGPFHTYRAFLDGPYGGMTRDLAAFDTCILIAGGSGITSLLSQLLSLVKRMRDGKAITRKVVVVWALKKPEDMDWFREELRICRESAPPESISCKFFVTTAVRNRFGQQMTAPINGINSRALTHKLHDKLDGFVAGIASKRNSALIQAEAQGDPERERELRAENEDRITALPPQKFMQPHQYPPPPNLPSNASTMSQATASDDNFVKFNENGYPEDKKEQDPAQESFPVAVPELAHLYNSDIPVGANEHPVSTSAQPAAFDFGFPQTPTEFQKNLMRSAFPVPHQTEDGWTIEYGRPDLGYMLKQWATGGPEGRGILGRRTAVFVCGPAGMRVGVANTVARLQAEIWGDDELEEIFLHTENYAL